MKHKIEEEFTKSPQKLKLYSEISLLITTILWGSTFIITNRLTQIIPPMFYMGIRYLIGFLAFIPFLGRLKNFTKEQFIFSIIAASLCWASFMTQTIGIKLTTATKSGFITGLNVIMVPIFIAIFYHQKISKKIWFSTVLALIGVSIMSFADFEPIAVGDILILICDVFYAFYIIYIAKNLKKVDLIGFSAILVFLLSLFSFISSLIAGEFVFVFGEGASSIFTTKNILVMLYMGLIATTVATLTQVFGQKNISAERSAVIFAVEPLFAAMFAVIFGDLLSLQTIIGGLIIMVGIFVSIEKTKLKENYQ